MKVCQAADLSVNSDCPKEEEEKNISFWQHSSKRGPHAHTACPVCALVHFSLAGAVSKQQAATFAIKYVHVKDLPSCAMRKAQQGRGVFLASFNIQRKNRPGHFHVGAPSYFRPNICGCAARRSFFCVAFFFSILSSDFFPSRDKLSQPCHTSRAA